MIYTCEVCRLKMVSSYPETVRCGLCTRSEEGWRRFIAEEQHQPRHSLEDTSRTEHERLCPTAEFPTAACICAQLEAVRLETRNEDAQAITDFIDTNAPLSTEDWLLLTRAQQHLANGTG